MTEIAEQTTAEAWRVAVRHLLARPGHRESSLIVRIAEPAAVDWPLARHLDDELSASAGETTHAVARTIMPHVVFRARNWLDAGRRLSRHLTRGSYFKRMIDYRDDGQVNQLANVIDALSYRTGTGSRWLDPGPILLERPGMGAVAHVGFPCLSLVQFHRLGEYLQATAVYRSHYYHEKAYGNFIGLSRLQQLVARECNLRVGELVVVSTDARLEQITAMRQLVAA